MGDISGKGIPAALMMTNLQAMIRTMSIAENKDTVKMLTEINKQMYRSTPGNRYATFFYSEFNNTNYMLEFINAGPSCLQ